MMVINELECRIRLSYFVLFFMDDFFVGRGGGVRGGYNNILILYEG